MAVGAKSCVFMLFLLFVCSFNKINAVSYVVGDGYGWSNVISMEGWPKGKTFYVGDVLEFKYDYQESNAVVTDKEGFLSCTVTANSTVYESGDDKIRLPFGQSYFICGYPEQCQGGMKIAIYAKNRPPL